MSFLKSNLWIFETHRPRMRVIDSLRHELTRELKEAVATRSVASHPAAQGMTVKALAYTALQLDEDEKEETVVITADDSGRIMTDDPVIALMLDKELRTLNPINHPLTKQAFVYALDSSSPPIPASLEAAEKMRKKEEKKA